MESLFGRNFPSLEAAREACDAIAREQGFALSVAAKKPNAASPTYVHLRCSKGRKYVDYGNEAIAKRRKTSTQMTECPYRLALKLDQGRGSWLVSCPSGPAHNHPFIDAMAQAKYRAEVVSKYRCEIVEMNNNGMRPAVIAAQLRGRSHQDPGLAGITATQIHNALARHRRDELPLIAQVS
ncbi:hypothetical protein HRG_010479 [Hirsutella rhossiliensis]|uniref:FAR1 domain-containing protein n=1 Tax=Hirsutella rhossiliensis TaxID=111463 RepID=A0A9P8MPP0_9HYPO|nr:uncharacterized protein HRG_10479 [Hirsutella rhossiliensis]KAH0958792.1 hypothetical protein HRG_10479 [Hirsutella rhossiliensis]